MKKPTYEQAVQAINRAFEAGDLTAEEKAEKLQLAEKLKKEKTPKKQTNKEKPEKPQPKAATEIDKCKEMIAQFKARQRAEKVEQARKELIAKAETPEKKEEIKQLPDNEVLAKANPKPRIDVFSKEKIKSLVLKNIENRQKNIPKTQKKTISEDKIKQVVNELYQELDKKIDKLLKN